MNGVHDMGGMQGMGPIEYEKNEPVFHAPWEGRVFALIAAMRRVAQVEHRRRTPRDRADPAGGLSAHELLRKVVRASGNLLVKRGLVTRAEIESGKPAPGSPKATPPLTRMQVAAMLANGALCQARRCRGAALPSRPACARPQHQSRWAHAAAALRARKNGHDRSRSWRLCVPGHQRPFPGRKSAACLLRALCGARIVGRASLAARRRLHRSVG